MISLSLSASSRSFAAPLRLLASGAVLLLACGPEPVTTRSDTGVPSADATDTNADSSAPDAAMSDSAGGLSPCTADMRVMGGVCTACAAGRRNAAGDDPSNGDTACDPTLCGVDQRVLENACVACVDSSTNAAGDDASGADTTCDSWCEGDIVLVDALVSGLGGTARTGRFDADGWTTTDAYSQLVYDFGSVVRSGSATFQMRGMTRDVTGCYPGWGVCYFASLYDRPDGNKGDASGFSGTAFIEARFHNQHGVNYRDIFKLQTGAGDIHEVITGTIGWGASEWHTMRLEWGGGRARLFADNVEVLSSGHNTDHQWRYLFLGANNFKNSPWAPIGVTFRNLCVTRR